jgi:choline dehydrogenase-like flavoprotein
VTFGIMIRDTSRGEVRPGLGGSPFITYNMNAHDTRQMARAVAILCEVFLEAGAKRVFPFLPRMQEIASRRDLERLRELAPRPGDFEVTAYHPLGTCRIGTDPRTSVLGPDHEAHEVAGLYVADGSAVPSALGVNPQLTIMAMAHRAAEILDARLS